MDQRFKDHFENPRGLGRLTLSSHKCRVTNPACGDQLDLEALIEDGQVVDIRMRVKGCASAVAAASALIELSVGRSSQHASKISKDALEGLIGPLPTLSNHVFDLAIEAMADLLNS
jgi:nitrogen fixation protein NifU and related proteins